MSNSIFELERKLKDLKHFMYNTELYPDDYKDYQNRLISLQNELINELKNEIYRLEGKYDDLVYELKEILPS